MSLNPVLEDFYLNILDFAGMKYEDGIIVNKDERIGDLTIKGKKLTLPYNSNLKHPKNRVIFHPLNENYTNPRTSQFNLFKKRLVLELNLKLSHLITSLATVASDFQMQKKIKSSGLIDLISELGEVDYKFIENFLAITKASKQENEEAFLFDLFIKKNGVINDVPFSAIGKVNFILYKEVEKVLEEGKSPYSIYGVKVRKKDLLTLRILFNLIFTDTDNEFKYTEGTDNKVFRCFNALLKVGYLVAKHINDITDMLEELKEPTLELDDCKSNLSWIKSLEKLYEMKNEIRLIPSQTDLTLEESKRLNIDETKVKEEETSIKSFLPEQVEQPVSTVQTQQQPTKLTPEEIIKGNLQQPMMQQPMIQQPMMQQGVMQQPQYTPRWVQAEAMKQQISTQQPMMQQGMTQQPMMQQPIMQQGMAQQPMIQQPMMQQGMAQQPMMQQPIMQQGMAQQPMTNQNCLQLNPMFS